MSLNDFSSIVVTADGPALTQVGFGTALMAAYHAHTPERVRVYTKLSDLVTDGFRTTEPAYRAAAVGFSQKPKPDRIKIGRCANAPVVSFRLTPLALNSAPYEIRIEYDGGGGAGTDGDLVPFGPQEIAFTSDGSGTVDEICDGLQSAIDAAFSVGTGGSATSIATGTGSKSFTVDTDLDLEVYPVGAKITCDSATDGDQMVGTITSYDSDTGALVVNVASVTGSGTNTDWEFTVSYIVVTPSGGTATHLDVTTVPGRTFYLTRWDHTRIQVQDNTPDPGIAADLTAIKLEDADFYGLSVGQNSAAILEEAADWQEAEGIGWFAGNNSDTRCHTNATTDIMTVLIAKSYARTTVQYSHADTGSFAGFADLCEMLPHDPGTGPDAGGVLNAKTLEGVSADVLTDTQKTALRNKRYITYTATAGRNLTLDGTTGNTPSGEFIDFARFVDWFRIRLQEKLVLLQANNRRVPYNERGISLVGAACRAQMSEGLRSGGINDPDSDGNPPTIQLPTMAQTTQQDRAARRLPGVQLKFQYSGAIQFVGPVSLNVTV